MKQIIEEMKEVNSEEYNVLKEEYERRNLTARTYHKILRVARTLADMDGEEMIRLEHLSEAICYRSINEKYWGREEQTWSINIGFRI